MATSWIYIWGNTCLSNERSNESTHSRHATAGAQAQCPRRSGVHLECQRVCQQTSGGMLKFLTPPSQDRWGMGKGGGSFTQGRDHEGGWLWAGSHLPHCFSLPAGIQRLGFLVNNGEWRNVHRVLAWHGEALDSIPVQWEKPCSSVESTGPYIIDNRHT